MDLDGLPGADLFEKGLEDLSHGIVSVEALLASISAPRLARIGIEVPGAIGYEESFRRAVEAVVAKEEGKT